MTREVDFLLVGGGMGSAHCAAELRRRGAEGSVLLVGREPEPDGIGESGAVELLI